MIAYLDTHVAVWLVDGQLKRLTRAALHTIEGCSLLVSPIVVLELEYMYEMGRIYQRSAIVLDSLKADLDVEICNLPFLAITKAAVFESWTRDIFDRLLVAHARANGVAALISADGHIQAN